MKKVLAAFAVCICVALACLYVTTSANAQSAYDNTWYALRNNWFTVPNYTDSDTVVNPGGEEVTVSGGGVRASMEGDYIITQGNTVSVVKVYRTAPEVTIELGGELSDNLCAGELLVLPSAIGKSEIKNYNEYEVEISLGGEIKKILTQSEGEYILPSAGKFAVTYVFTDVFGVRTELTKNISVADKPVIVLQRFPQKMAFGSSIKTDATYGYYNGVMYECAVEVKDKSGTRALTENIFTPLCNGVNELTFTCEINGTTLTRSVSIEVEYTEESMFITNGISGITPNVAYPASANVDKSGVYITGDSGAVAHFTKTLNLKELSRNNMNIIEFQPYSEKGTSISEVRITLTDVFDSNNTLSVYWWMSPWNEEVSYMLVEYDTQSIAISNESSDRGVVRNQYGTVTQHTFNNVKNSKCTPFNFRYDYETQTVYSAINSTTRNYKVLDTDNTAELKAWKPFKGFKGEDVYLSIELTVSNKAGIVIGEIGGEVLDASAENMFVNRGIIQIMRDSSIEEGVVGYEYMLPYSLSADVLHGDVEFKRTLEYLDSGEYRRVIRADGEVTDNVFVPKVSGTFRAVFSGKDNFGSNVEKTFVFNVKEQPDDIFIKTNAVTSVDVRSDFILPTAEISGGTGKTETSYQVYYGGKYRYMQPGERMYIDSPGKVMVGIIVKDELGFVKTASYTVAVNSNLKFIIVKSMPQVCVNGELLDMPDVTGLDYSVYGTERFEFPVSVYVNGEKVDMELGYRVNTSEDNLIVTLSSGDGSISESRLVRVIPSSVTSIADMLVYDRDIVSTEFYETGLTFSTSADTEITMPYALPYYGLNLRFTALESSTNYQKAEVILVSDENEEQKVTLGFMSLHDGKASMTADGKTYSVKVENGVYGALSSYNGEEYNTVSLSYSLDGTVSINGTEICKITAYDSGRVFTGFDGGKVRITFAIKGVASNSKFVINLVANQSFTLYTKDFDETMAVVGLLRDVTSEEYTKGSIFELPDVVTGDVLTGSVTGKLSVFAPDGTALITNVELNKKQTITFDNYGYYRLEYTVTDGAFNTGKRIFRIHVADVTPPVIVIGDITNTSVKVGNTVTVPSVTVTDDNPNGEITYYIYLRTPETLLIRVSDGDSIALSSEGTYRIIVYAFDESGNINYESVDIEVVK